MLPKETPEILTPEETAKILRIGKNAIYSLLRDNIIPHRKNGVRYLIPKKAIEDYLKCY